MLEQPGQEAACAKAHHIHALGGEDGIDGPLAGLGIERAARGFEVARAVVQRGGEDLGHRGRAGQFVAQALHRGQRGLEAAHEFGAELRIAFEAERPGKAVGRGHGHIHSRREFVDAHGRRAEQVVQHVLRHALMRGRQRGQAAGDAFGNRLAFGHVWGKEPVQGAARTIPESPLMKRHFPGAAVYVNKFTRKPRTRRTGK
ncbi:hypothetical protein D3C86_1321910 [compost metagenome]